MHAQEAAECHREGWQYSIPPSISQRALQPNKEIFQPDQSVSRSCMYCNIVQLLNTVVMSIRVYTRVSYVHMILENFCKTSGVVCEIYSLLRVISCFVNLAFSVWKQRTEMKLCKVISNIHWTHFLRILFWFVTVYLATRYFFKVRNSKRGTKLREIRDPNKRYENCTLRKTLEKVCSSNEKDETRIKCTELE